MTRNTTHNRIDGTRPDAPLLAGYGPYAIGVRGATVTDPARFDPYTGATGPRSLPVELWYPAATGTEPGGHYDTILRDGETPVRLFGRASRDAKPEGGRFPLVVVSHGYPGNRYLMSHLCETLASRGFVVAACDHPQSTYDDQGPFGATLFHRPLDQRLMLTELAQEADVSADKAALIGYSMGGYGALVTGGAGVVPDFVTHDVAPPNGSLACHDAAHAAPAPANLGAIVAFGPWGMGRGIWDAGGLSALRVPLMVIAGSVDHISDYDGMRKIAGLAGSEHRHLLTFENAGHNAAAPIPAPTESHAHSEKLGWPPFQHYADPVWDTVRMNGVAQHFAAAFLARHLRDDTGMSPHLAPETALGDSAGFSPETAVGLRFESW